jgi:CIC family chloride channel protein
LKTDGILVKLLIWRLKYINDKTFVLIIAGVIGIVAGFAAVTLKETVHALQQFLTQDFTIEFANYLYLSYPFVGILLTYLVAKYLLKESLGHGITSVLYSISKKSSIITRVKTFSRMITSALTVGFGGSVGLEAPIVVTGSAIGSNIARTMHLNYKKRTILIGCGASGAIAAIFNSPVAGAIFSLEVILSEVTLAGFIPVLISSVTASLVSLSLLGDDVLFSFKLRDSFTAGDTPYYLLLGLLCGVISVYFTRITFKVEGLISGVSNGLLKTLIGGLSLGLIIFIFPPIYGEGYDTIKLLLAGNSTDALHSSLFFSEIKNPYFILLFMLGVLLIKPLASAVTIGAGGSGGIFAPSLFIGGVLGFLFSAGSNTFLGTDMSTSNFILVGMCGVMSGVLHAPLTAMFLIAEITSGYELFIPLMMVSAIAYSTSTFFEKHSLYTKHLIERGDLIKYDKDRQVLSLIDLRKIVEKDLLQIDPEASLNELVELVKTSKRNVFPVVNQESELQGVITLDDIRDIMFDQEKRQAIQVKSLMRTPPASVSPTENMESVMSKFEVTGAWNLPVIEDGKYFGFISKSRIFNTYRKKLIRQQKE